MCCFIRHSQVKLILFTGVQATVSCKDVGVGTSNADPLCLSSTLIKRPPKRPCLDLNEELEDIPLEGSSLVDASKGQDSTYDPADSITTSLDSTQKDILCTLLDV